MCCSKFVTLIGWACCSETGMILVFDLVVLDAVGTFAVAVVLVALKNVVELDNGENILFLLCKFYLQIYSRVDFNDEINFLGC